MDMKITINVHPNSKNPRVENREDGTIHIFVSSPAKEGRANREVVKKLAEIYNIPKSSITLLRGEKSKTKVFEILE